MVHFNDNARFSGCKASNSLINNVKEVVVTYLTYFSGSYLGRGKHTKKKARITLVEPDKSSIQVRR